MAIQEFVDVVKIKQFLLTIVKKKP